MKLPTFAVNRFVTVIMIFLAVLILGSAALFVLPIDLLPEIEIPAISIVTIYPGASAEDVESKVTKKIEDFVSTVNNLDKLTSVSRENVSLITCEFDWETNLDEASNDIRDKLELVKRDLPDDAEDPILFKLSTSQFPILVYGVTAKENYEGLYHIVENGITDPLKRIPGVGTVQIMGGLERQIRVDFDPARIEAYNLSVGAILGTIDHRGQFQRANNGPQGERRQRPGVYGAKAIGRQQCVSGKKSKGKDRPIKQAPAE